MHFRAIFATLFLIGIPIIAYSASGQTFPAHARSTLVDRTISARELTVRLLNELETRGNKQSETIIPASTGQGREPTKDVTKKHGRLDQQLEDQLRRKEMFTSKHGGLPPHMDIMIQKLGREKQLHLVREELRKVEGVLERELANAKDGFEVPFVTMLKKKKLELQGKESRLK